MISTDTLIFSFSAWDKIVNNVFIVFSHTSVIEQLKINLENQEAMIRQNKCADQEKGAPSANGIQQLSDLIAKKDQELEVWNSYEAIDMNVLLNKAV